MATGRIVVRAKDGFPVDVILYPPDGYLEMLTPDPIWREKKEERDVRSSSQRP